MTISEREPSKVLVKLTGNPYRGEVGHLRSFSKVGPMPVFRIGDVPVYGDSILSPMDGFSDLPGGLRRS